MSSLLTGNPLPIEVWRSLRQEWLWVYHGEAPQIQKWSGDILAPLGVFFVERGSVRINVQGNEIHVPQGQSFFSGLGQRRQWFDTKTRLLSVGLRCTWPDGASLWNQGLNIAVPTAQIEALHDATRHLFREIYPDKQRVTYQEATAVKNQTLSIWAAHEAAFRAWFATYAETLDTLGIAPEGRLKASDRQLQSIVRWLDALPLDQSLSWNHLPSTLRLGSRRIEQLLHQHLGISARGYLERRRLEAARKALLNEDTALKEIAFTLGFRHASHFTAWFRRGTGIAPSVFRESGGGEAA